MTSVPGTEFDASVKVDFASITVDEEVARDKDVKSATASQNYALNVDAYPFHVPPSPNYWKILYLSTSKIKLGNDAVLY
jgi:hypothetical protein